MDGAVGDVTGLEEFAVNQILLELEEREAPDPNDETFLALTTSFSYVLFLALSVLPLPFPYRDLCLWWRKHFHRE